MKQMLAAIALMLFVPSIVQSQARPVDPVSAARRAALTNRRFSSVVGNAHTPAAQRVQATLPLAGYTDRSSPASTACR